MFGNAMQRDTAGTRIHLSAPSGAGVLFWRYCIEAGGRTETENSHESEAQGKQTLPEIEAP